MSGFDLRALDVQDDGRAAPWAGRLLLLVSGLLVLFGFLSVYSASSFLAASEGLPDTHYLVEQVGRAAVGGIALVVGRFVDYRVWRRLAWPLVGISVVLLSLLLLPWTTEIAPRINGARRWLVVGPALQPSELAKFAVVVWTAALAVKKQDRLDDFRYGLGPFLVVVGLICALVVLEPHFSAAVYLALLAAVVLFVAGARLLHFLALSLAALPVVATQIAGTGYRLSRIEAMLGSVPDPGGVGYQLRQSLIAVGSGGAFGVGFGESRQKLYYLPEPQNDFIFSIIAEEWGFVGSLVVVGLFLTWTLAGLAIARSAPDLFGQLLAVGLTALVAIAAFAHLGVTLGLLPPTGINLPFVSAGGTNLVLVLGATGVLVNVASRRRC